MKALNGIKAGLICAASALAVSGLIGYLIFGAWHLLLITITAGAIGLTLKEEEGL